MTRSEDDLAKVITAENAAESYLEEGEELTEEEFRRFHAKLQEVLTDYVIADAEEVLEILRPKLKPRRLQ